MQQLLHYTSKYIISRLISNYVKPYKWSIVCAIFFMIVVATCNALTVKLVEPVIDQVFLTHDKQKLIAITFLTVGIYSIKGVAEYFQSYIVKYVGQRILTNLQVQMYEHLLFADVAFIQSQSSGRLISRFTNDIVLMRSAIANLLVGFAKHLLSVIFLVVVMFKLEPYLSLFVFFVFPVAIYPVQKLGRKMRKMSSSAQDELGNYTARLDETFHSIKVVKSFTAEMLEANKAIEVSEKILTFYRRSARFDALTSPVTEILSGFAIACILWYGGIMIIEDKTTPGALFAFITAFVSAYRPFKSLLLLNVNLQEGIAAANRVFNILDTEPVIKDKPDSIMAEFIEPEILFNDVSLHFGKKIALQNTHLRLERGKTYAFVGRSGSGKTSLANLLVRFYDSDTGKIFINNYDISKVSISCLRNQIAMVSQDVFLFNTTIKENIAYGKVGCSEEEIVAASKAADAHDFICAMPHGYDTVIGTQGLTLSGGQRQKLSIARAFLKDAPILVFDEATSALDPNSEVSVMHSLRRLRAGKINLIITHRIASIKDVDQIVVMKHGKVVEQGTHAELLKQGKEYFKLYNKELRETEK